MILGLDYIGGVNYIDVITKHHPVGYAAGFLCRASGWKNGLLAAEALAATGKCNLMRIHGLWRDNHNFNQDDCRYAAREAGRVAELAKKYPAIKFFFSPWLEHRAPNWLFAECREKCRKVLPRTIPIVSSGTIVRGVCETHHGSPISGRYIFSFDGVDMFGESVKCWKDLHKNAIQFYGWTVHCNGKKTVDDSTPRPERKDWLTKEDIQKMVRMMER